jgi:hypothetical protein
MSQPSSVAYKFSGRCTVIFVVDSPSSSCAGLGLNPHCSEHHCAELELCRWLYLSNPKMLPGGLRDHQGASPPPVLITRHPPDGIGFNFAAASVVSCHW